MVQCKKNKAITKYKKNCNDYFTLIHEYRNHTNIRIDHESVYKRINRLAAMLEKPSPYISRFEQERIRKDAQVLICGESESNEEEEEEEEEEENTEDQSLTSSELDLNEEEHNAFLYYCENCLRKQSVYLVSTLGEVYNLQFRERSKYNLKMKKKFRFAPRERGDDEHFYLCQECDSFLVTEDDGDTAKSAKFTWPSFIISTLMNENVISVYGNRAWQLVPTYWRHWWVETLPLATLNGYNDITIDYPPSIITDRTCELNDWKNKNDSNMLFEIAQACNRHMMPTVLCPWGCTEFIFRSGYLSIDLIYQRFLRKTSLTMIHDVNTMKYVTYCRDDYIRFDNKYEYLLLNEKDWTVVPSVYLQTGYGVQVMTCKDHDQGCTKCMIHPPRQPNYILPCKYIQTRCVTQL